MKKRVFALLMILVMILVSSCGPASGNNNNVVPANNTANDVEPGGNTDPDNDPSKSNTVDPVEDPQARIEKIYENGIVSTEDMMLFLDGSWALLKNGGSFAAADPVGDLIFDSNTGTAEFVSKTADQFTVNLKFSSRTLHTDMKTVAQDIIHLEVSSASDLIKRKYPGIESSSSDFQIFAFHYGADDYLFIREVGNGMSEFAYSVLRDENVTTEGCWVFCRNSGSLSKTALNEEYFAKKRYAGVTFMALRWVDMIDSCYLTPVNFEYQQETFFADPENVIWIAYNKDGFALHGIRYELAQPTGAMPAPSFDPQLVEVTVDGNGKITEIYQHPYAGYGVYSPNMIIPGQTGIDLESVYMTGIKDHDELMAFLDGSWSMLPKGARPGEVQEYAYLTFDGKAEKAYFDLKLGGVGKAEMSFTTEKLYKEMKNASEDSVRFFVTKADGMDVAGQPSVIGTTAQYQVFAARCKDNDILILRPIGYYPSAMTELILGEFNQTDDMCFVFYRIGGTKSAKILNDDVYADTRFRSVKFMAVRWQDFDGTSYLLPVEYEIFKSSIYDQPEDFIRIRYASENAMYCIKYDKQNGSGESGPGPFEPQLVEVTVGKDQKITDVLIYKYAGFGVYYKDGAVPEQQGGGGSEYRDPATYGFTDSFFVKTWYEKENTKRTLVVTKDSVQVGGYKIVFDVPDGGKGECYAYPNDGDLVINQGFINGQYRISGYMRQSDEVSLRFTITESDYRNLPSGSTLWYQPKK